MSVEQALLQDVFDHPDDDTPRLVLADWWDEYGDEPRRARADLVRAQIALTRASPEDTHGNGLRFTEARLLSRYGPLWLSALPVLEGVTWTDEFVRGFVERASVSAPGVFRAHSERLFATVPLRALAVRGLTDLDALLDLLGIAALGRVRQLDLGNNQLSPESVRLLVDSPCVARLTALLLHGNRLGDLGAEILARTGPFPRLAELYLSGNEVGDQGAARLASSDRFPALTLLDLRDNQVGNHGLTALAESSSLAGLLDLWLINNGIGEAGALALTPAHAQPHLPRLRSLWLSHNPIGDSPVVALADDPVRAALRDLDLRWCGLSDASGAALAGSPHLEKIAQLRLAGNLIPPLVLRALRERFGTRLVA